MTDYRTAGSLGERIQAARKARGMSVRELAETIDGVPTQSTIENIELGRKAAIDVVQLLNIAMALRVPLSNLLAPMGMPDGTLDLPGLSREFADMTPSELDAWLSSLPDGARIPASLDERNAVAELQALREWRAKTAEVVRLEAMYEVERSIAIGSEATYLRSTEERLTDARREAKRLATFLRSAGWPV